MSALSEQNIVRIVNSMSCLSLRSGRDPIEEFDEDYRTCAACGGDCVPEPDKSEGYGVCFLWVCPEHGIHSVVDPFEDLKDRD